MSKPIVTILEEYETIEEAEEALAQFQEKLACGEAENDDWPLVCMLCGVFDVMMFGHYPLMECWKCFENSYNPSIPLFKGEAGYDDGQGESENV